MRRVLSGAWSVVSEEEHISAPNLSLPELLGGPSSPELYKSLKTTDYVAADSTQESYERCEYERQVEDGAYAAVMDSAPWIAEALDRQPKRSKRERLLENLKIVFGGKSRPPTPPIEPGSPGSLRDAMTYEACLTFL
jgi:hypothetical protein